MRWMSYFGLVPLVLAAAVTGGAQADYAKLDGKAEPLRSAFNADVGKVRVLMLVAPT
jgi:hypothetical protein